MTTKLQRKRAAARNRKHLRQCYIRLHGIWAHGYGSPAWSAYHTKRPRWLHGMGRNGLPLGGRYVLAELLPKRQREALS